MDKERQRKNRQTNVWRENKERIDKKTAESEKEMRQ